MKTQIRTQDELKRNLEIWRKQYRTKVLESGRHFIPAPHTEAEKRLIEIAMSVARTKKEWQDLEADDRRIKATGQMTQKSSSELLDRCLDAVQRGYKAEKWFAQQLQICDAKISEILMSTMPKRKRTNKLKHWRERRVWYDIGLVAQMAKTHRLEFLANKWRSVREQIRIADVAKEIRAERGGTGNKYGFNPTMQSRETAAEMFNDFEY